MPVSVTSFTNLRRPRSKQSARHVKTQLPTARSSFSKSPEVSRSMVSSIWKPEMVMYLSNTAKQNSALSGNSQHCCHCPSVQDNATCVSLSTAQVLHSHSLSCSEPQFPIRCPFPAPGTAPCIIPNALTDGQKRLMDGQGVEEWVLSLFYQLIK